MTARDLLTKCKDHIEPHLVQVDELIQALDRRGALVKAGPHFWYEPSKIDRGRREEIGNERF